MNDKNSNMKIGIIVFWWRNEHNFGSKW